MTKSRHWLAILLKKQTYRKRKSCLYLMECVELRIHKKNISSVASQTDLTRLSNRVNRPKIATEKNRTGFLTSG